jgi:lipoyl(octanoyl) transferase
MRDLRVWWLGRMAYEEAHALQQRLLERVFSGEDPDTLLLLEHDPVITCGRGSDHANLSPSAARLPVFEVERGGDVTWHGPGQLVGYPILRLEGAERDLRAHLRRLEEVLIRTCRALGCPAGRRPGFTGVWTPPESPARKLASIGVAVRRWVTWHGFALNIATDPAAFTLINPCGLEAGLMTSLAAECPRPPGRKRTIEALARQLPEVFDRRPRFERAPARPYGFRGMVPDSVVRLPRTG